MPTKKSIRNFNEKPAKLFIGKTIEKPGSDTLITLRASGPVFCCYRFFRLPLPRLLLGDFSISDLRRMPMFDMENVQAAWEERDKEMLKVLLHTLSTAMVPELEKKGYDKAYLAALIAASSPFGFMIPPNVNAIIFASVSSASVGALFMATIVPGLIWAGLYLIINRIIYIKYYHPEYAGKTVASVSACTEDNEPKEESEKNARETISRNRFFLELVVAVLMPIIVLGGIYGGIFTATEAGAITCLYGAIMGVVVYKKLSLVQLMGVFSKGVKDVSALVIMFPMTLIFSRLMTLNHIPELVAELMLGITNNRIGLILLIDLLLFFIGFFLDGNVIILTLVPLLTPIATACGIDTIQLAVIVFVSIGIGSITPPMATCLMACSRVCDVPIHKLIKPILPFLLFGALPILLLVSFVPVVSTWLPGLFYSF